MIYQGILFDFDGVVLDSMKYHFQAWHQAFLRHDVVIDREFFYLQEGQGIEGVGKSLVKKAGLNHALLPAIMEDKVHYFNQLFQVEFYEGFFRLLDFLSGKNLKLGIVTGGMRARIMPFVDKYLNGHFDVVITADDVSRTKPNPEPYMKGAEKLHVDRRACLVIENAPLGIRSGKKAGMTVIALETTLDKKHLKEADYCLDSFDAVQKLIATLL
jgi:beta-phosphoglucomutase